MPAAYAVRNTAGRPPRLGDRLRLAGLPGQPPRYGTITEVHTLTDYECLDLTLPARAGAPTVRPVYALQLADDVRLPSPLRSASHPFPWPGTVLL